MLLLIRNACINNYWHVVGTWWYFVVHILGAPTHWHTTTAHDHEYTKLFPAVLHSTLTHSMNSMTFDPCLKSTASLLTENQLQMSAPFPIWEVPISDWVSIYDRIGVVISSEFQMVSA